MSDTVKREGKCLCGRITVSAGSIVPHVHACHCNMCQAWNGGPTLSLRCGTDVTFSNEQDISVYRSCDWAELGFCKHCGSHLFYRLVDSGEYVLQSGTFANSDEFVLDEQIFIDEKPAFYDFANKTHNLTGAEVWAQYETDDS